MSFVANFSAITTNADEFDFSKIHWAGVKDGMQYGDDLSAKVGHDASKSAVEAAARSVTKHSEPPSRFAKPAEVELHGKLLHGITQAHSFSEKAHAATLVGAHDEAAKAHDKAKSVHDKYVDYYGKAKNGSKQSPHKIASEAHALASKQHRDAIGRFASNQDSSLESLTRNYSAKSYREETVNGRQYIVSPMTMIVPGVLNGSKGRLLYPEDEVGKDPTPWNGMPITHYHPSVDGKPVSANHEKAKAQHIGFVSKSTSLGKLKAEAWIDIEKADARDSRIVQSVRNGNPMEISTGLYTDNFPAPKGSMWKGKPYDHIARNYRPDHLAILPDQKGACSLKDGCGLGINRELVDNDWAEWNKTHGKTKTMRMGGGIPLKGRKATPGGSDPKALARATKSHAAWLKRDPAKAKGNAAKAQKELAKAKQAHTHTKRAVALATKHMQEKADHHKNASALVRAHLDAAKAHSTSGNHKAATKSLDKARKAVVDYSKKRASQHEKVAASFAKAGDHKMAAHYKARADFHHAHVAKITKKTPATNSEFMPKGEREFVMNQLSEAKEAEITKRVEAKKLEMAQVTKKPAINSNPTGINQYTKHSGVAQTKSATAHAASQAAIKAKTPSAHLEAAKAHKEASAAQSLAGGYSPKKGFKLAHDHTSKAHDTQAAYHEHVAGTRKKPTKNQETKFFITENAMSHEELRGKLDHALRSKLTQNDPTPYLHEVHDDHVKYEHGGEMKKCAYKVTDNDEVKVGKPKTLKRVTTYEEAEPDGDEPEMNQLTEDGIEPSTTTPRKGGNMAKLTANQRTATIDKLTSNEGCGCFNEEDKDYLSGLSDERLQAMAENHAKHTDPEDDDDEEPEDVQTDNKEKKPVNNSKKERMTVNEFREIAPVEYLEAVDHAARITNAEKAKIVTKLTSHLKDGDVKKRLTANLSKQSLEALEDQLLLIPEPVKAAAPATRTVYGPTGNSIVTDDPVDNEEDDVAQMLSPRIDYVALSKEHAEMSRRN